MDEREKEDCMKILLIHPNINQKIIYGQIREVGNIQQPLGIAYIAAVLEKEGYEVKIIDALVKDYEENFIIETSNQILKSFIL